MRTVGPSGVGKTRLARAALAEAGQAGAAPLWVQATRSAATIPLGALAGVLPGSVGSDDPLTVLRTSTQALTELAGRRQLVLGVDDAQHLDPTSAALVLHLAGTSAAFIVVTVCSGEQCPDAIQALWKDASAQHLALGALDESQTDQLLEAIVGGPVEAGVRRWIWELSRGNALYVTELLRGLLAGGAFSLQDGLWWMSEHHRCRRRWPSSCPHGSRASATAHGAVSSCSRSASRCVCLSSRASSRSSR